MIRLGDREAAVLLREPESGVGYQLVEIDLESGKTQRGIALNAEYFASEAELDAEPLDFRFSALAAKLSKEALGYDPVAGIRVLGRAEPYVARAVERGVTAGGSSEGPAAEAPLQHTAESEVFKRFTAYENDRRIQEDGSLLPGTYATTEQDAQMVRTGAEAVERYALPDPTPAVYVFTVSPDEETPIRRGTVQPAHGRNGGGAEVLFDEGTQAGSVSEPEQIPDQ